MAKVPFSKLQACVNTCDCKTFYYNKAGEEVHYEIKRYLPIKDKIELVQNVINQSVDENGFYNPMRVDLFLTLEFVYAYTNLSFTDKMKEDPFKLYDLLVSTGIILDVINGTDEKEYAKVRDDVYNTIKNIYDYKNSVMGILEAVAMDYKNLNLDAEAIQKALNDPESIELLRNILDKLG
jgi:hypothetical protein